MPDIIGIDTGGTFTDFVLLRDGHIETLKVPSTPDDPSRAAEEGARALASPGDVLAHGTTVGTNALLERKGARTVLVTTAGFEDVLQIGRQARPELYALEPEVAEPLVPADLRLGADERMGAKGEVVRSLTTAEAERIAGAVVAAAPDAVAVSLLFSFLDPAHERMLAEAIRHALPECFVSVSSDVLPEFREYERTSTVVANAYIGPVMSNYLGRMEDRLKARLRVMQSSGGSIPVELARRQPVRTVLSGPAGGVIGASHVARSAGFDQLITLDMGGTSTDVALCPGGVQLAHAHNVGGTPIGASAVDIETVGAGGGSIARVDAGGALRVGPESAGAVPGPACYGVGDEPTVTDANLVLGRMVPEHFVGGRMALDAGRATEAVARLGEAMGMSTEDAALGVVRIANAVMERALRAVSLERGHDPRDFVLVAFGGAGPQHACELATGLGVGRVLVPRHPGVLSALGVGIADVVRDFSRTVMARDADALEALPALFAEMESEGFAALEAEGFARDALRTERSADARYVGQAFELSIPWPEGAGPAFHALSSAFHEAHERRFGYANRGAAVEVVTARLRVVAPTPPRAEPRLERTAVVAEPVGERQVWFEAGPQPAPVYDRDQLAPGHAIAGAALVVQMDATTVVPPGWSGEVDDYGNLVLRAEGGDHGR